MKQSPQSLNGGLYIKIELKNTICFLILYQLLLKLLNKTNGSGVTAHMWKKCTAPYRQQICTVQTKLVSHYLLVSLTGHSIGSLSNYEFQPWNQSNPFIKAIFSKVQLQ